MKINKWFWIILMLVVSANFFRIPGLNKTHKVSIDFRTLYLGSSLMSKSQNPYNDSLIKNNWNSISKDSSIVLPGKPGLPSLYPLNALVMFMPIAKLDFNKAQNIFFIFNLILLFLISRLLQLIGKHYLFKIPWYFWLILIFALKYNLPALWVGQTVFLCTALILASWWCSLKEKNTLAGILLGLAAFKFTLVIHLGMFFLVKRKWKTIAVSLIAFIGLFSLAFVFIPSNLVLTDYFETMKFTRKYIFDSSRIGFPYTHEMLSITEFGTILQALWSGFNLYLGIIYGFLIAATLLFIRKVNRIKPLNDIQWMAVLGVLNMLTVYHLYYDTLILLPMVWLITSLKNKFKWAMILIALPLFVPFRAISNYGDGNFNWLGFDNSLACLGMFIILIYSLFDGIRKTA